MFHVVDFCTPTRVFCIWRMGRKKGLLGIGGVRKLTVFHERQIIFPAFDETKIVHGKLEMKKTEAAALFRKSRFISINFPNTFFLISSNFFIFLFKILSYFSEPIKFPSYWDLNLQFQMVVALRVITTSE